MFRYFSNPYILIGSAGIIYYLWRRKQLFKPKRKKKKNEISSGGIIPQKNEFKDLPQNFKDDVAKMSKEEILRTIGHNDKMVKRARMSEAKRKGIKQMIEYLMDEYDTRTS